MGGRKARDDEFRVRVVFQVAEPGASLDDTDTTVETLYAALENLVAADPSLGSMDGVVHALIGTVEGPDGELTDEGAVSFITAEVSVLTRLH